MAHNLLGRRFGELFVVEKIKEEGVRYLSWRCVCDCGGERIVRSSYLTMDRVTHCGCKSQRRNFGDISGKRFGKLIVIEKDKRRNKGSAKWICQCDCGVVKPVAATELMYGNTKSCGCLRSESKVKYTNTEGFVIGETMNGDIFKIDADDFELISEYNWYSDGDGYIVSRINNKRTFLSRFIMNPREDQVVDHINHDIFDNRKCNLRLLTLSQNAMNRRIHSNNTSGVKGVHYHKTKKKWCAYICVNRKQITLGAYDSKEVAVLARKEAEIKYFGEYNYDPTKDYKNAENDL